jgi:glycosyltransferase involved in cell wall biosynthesis
LGAVAEEEKMASYYKTADLVVLPTRYLSHARWGENRGPEGWGLVINEAMSMGKPILTTDRAGAAPDLVKDGINGFVVRSGDVEALYSGLKSLLDGTHLREAMGKNSRRIFEQFNDFDRMFEGFRKAIEYAKKRDA